MNHRAYAKAIVRLSTKDDTNKKTLAENVIVHLAKRGQSKLLPNILRELKEMQAKRQVRAPLLEVAHGDEKEHAIAELKKIGMTIDTAHVNHSLIRGWRARSGGTLIDMSAKRALVDLYKNITS